MNLSHNCLLGRFFNFTQLLRDARILNTLAFPQLRKVKNSSQSGVSHLKANCGIDSCKLLP
jgi:hypothetical protein